MPEGLMKGNIANVQHWASQIEVDWFTYFIKAWIPFNAWYSNAFEEESDRQIINALKGVEHNPVRSKVVRLLENSDEDANAFKHHVAQLHTALEAQEVVNRGRRLTFTNAYLGPNPKQQCSERGYQNAQYVIERGVGRAVDPSDAKNKRRVACEITKGARTRLLLIQNRFNEDELIADSTFLALRLEWQTQFLNHYRGINPNLMMDLLSRENSRIPVGLAPSGARDDPEFNMIKFGTYNFCNHPENIYFGLLEILYGLRCLLFHGEIVPTPETRRLYEPAYFILRRFLKCIV